MAFFYPRKQTFLIFLVSILAVSGALYYTKSNSASAQNEDVNVATSHNAAAVAENQAIVSNTDWQKQFFGSATPKKTSATGKKPVSALKTPALSTTDKLGQQFFTSFVQLRQANLLDNTDIVNQTADNLAAASIDAQSVKVYTQSSLHVTNSADAQTLRTYSNSAAHAIESYTAKENVSAVMNDYLVKNDPVVLRRLDPVIAAQKKLIVSLLYIPVPTILVSSHLELVNALSELLSSTESLRVSDSDTVQSLAGVKLHVTAVQDVVSALTDVHSTLGDRGVDFMFEQSVLNTLLQ